MGGKSKWKDLGKGTKEHMKIKSKKITRSITVYLTPEQHESIRIAAKNSPAGTVTAHARKLLLGKPVTTFFRDRSLDEFIEIAIRMKKDLMMVLEKEGLNEEEKRLLFENVSDIKMLMIKIDEYVRESKKKDKSEKRHRL